MVDEHRECRDVLVELTRVQAQVMVGVAPGAVLGGLLGLRVKKRTNAALAV